MRIDDYLKGATPENFDWREYVGRYDERILKTSKGRITITKYDPMLFALIYLRNHLSTPRLGITFATAHFEWARMGLHWAISPKKAKEQRYAFISPRKSAKALDVDTPVFTHNRGWVRHGDIVPGDYVYGSDGLPTLVTLVTHYQDRPSYKITFSDKSEIIADEDHLWNVHDRYSNKEYLTLDTKTIAGRYLLPTSGETRYSLPPTKPVLGNHQQFIINPYVLGVWLGDGTTSAASITSGSQDVDEMEQLLISCGESVKRSKTNTAYRLQLYKTDNNSCLRGHKYVNGITHCKTCIAMFQKVSYGTLDVMPPVVNNTFYRRLKELNLLGNKHIPTNYMESSIDQRLALLQGLMDTDGTVDKKGRATFTQGRNGYNLCVQVRELSDSLGIRTTMREGRAVLKGKDCGPVYQVSMVTNLPIFRLQRKLSLIKDREPKKLTITNVERVENRDTNCISVDAPDHLYVAGKNFVLTHNSSWWFLFLPMWAAAHGHKHFVAAFADSRSQATGHLATFRKELDNNPLLQEDFPELCTPKADRAEYYESESKFVFVAKGVDAKSLGLKVGEVRPDVILLDDIEPDEAKYSPHLAKKRLGTVTDAILPLNDMASVVLVGTVTMSGSITHQCVKAHKGLEISAWIDDEKFKCFHYKPIITKNDGTECSMWPAVWPMEYLEEHRNSRSYRKNFDNDPVSVDGGYWQDDDIKIAPPIGATRHLLSIDPAVTTKTTSDFTGIAHISWTPKRKVTRQEIENVDHETFMRLRALNSTGICHVHDIWEVKMVGKELRNKVLQILSTRPEIKLILVESNQAGEHWQAILHDMPCKVKTVWNGKQKEQRAADLLNHYQLGKVDHVKQLHKLEEQMTAFPDVVNDDLIDAVGTGVFRFIPPPDMNYTVSTATIKTSEYA